MSTRTLSVKFSMLMPRQESKNDCLKNFAAKGDLGLPEIRPEDEPLPSGVPTWEAQMAHARLLLLSTPPEVWEERRAQMNSERFVLE